MVEITSDIKILGVIGNPIRHSISPIIHNYVYKEMLGINAIYLPIEAKFGYFEKVLDGLCFLENAVGFNITVPFKERAVKSMDWLSEPARFIGAVNVVKRGEDKLIGYNTDWIGFVESLKVNKVDSVESALVIGVGGAGKAIVYGLINMGVSRILITNRDKVKLSMVAENYKDYVETVYWEDVNSVIGTVDLVINATSVGLDGLTDLPFDVTRIKRSAVVYDTIYNPYLTPFLFRAKREGLKTINGLDMLIIQALYSIEIWFGKLPNFYEVKSFVVKKLGVD